MPAVRIPSTDFHLVSSLGQIERRVPGDIALAMGRALMCKSTKKSVQPMPALYGTDLREVQASKDVSGRFSKEGGKSQKEGAIVDRTRDHRILAWKLLQSAALPLSYNSDDIKFNFKIYIAHQNFDT